MGPGAYDADNHACKAGACIYAGCHDDTECVTTFKQPGYVCRKHASYPVPFCEPGCQTAADCKTDSGALDAGDYACGDGGCLYLGCHDDAECVQTYGNPSYVCPG